MNTEPYGIKREKNYEKTGMYLTPPSTYFYSKKPTPYNYPAGLYPQQYGKLF